MTAGFVAGVVIVLVIAVVFAIGIRMVRGPLRRRRTAFAGERVLTTNATTLADGPRIVPETAELRDTDVCATIPDGRLTKAGLLSLIVRNSETAIAVVDQFRDVVLYNRRAADLGLVRERLLADPVWDAAAEVLDTKATTRFEFSPPESSLGFVSTGRASQRSVESVRCVALLVTHGQERYAVVYGVDDTEHLRVEATRRDFVANVSHELKTPVGAISLLAEALMESSDDPDSVDYFAGRVIGETERMNNMVTELIALSRLQGGETADMSAVHVDELVDEALESAAVSAESAEIKLCSDEPIGLTVRGDRVLLLTALNNLIINAIAYSSANTTVSVSRRVDHVDGRPMVAIAVTDRGIGIAPADQQRVFERFFRVDKARSRLTGGTGLGLAIVKHVAANHNGTISLWSKPGLGSTFTLCVPEDLTGELEWARPGRGDETAVGVDHARGPTDSQPAPADTLPTGHVSDTGDADPGAADAHIPAPYPSDPPPSDSATALRSKGLAR